MSLLGQTYQLPWVWSALQGWSKPPPSAQLAAVCVQGRLPGAPGDPCGGAEPFVCKDPTLDFMFCRYSFEILFFF